MLTKLLLLCFLVPFAAQVSKSGGGREQLTSVKRYRTAGRSIVVTTRTGQRIRITPYGDYIIRIQVVRNMEDFFPDDHYEMIQSRVWDGALQVSRSAQRISLETKAAKGIRVAVQEEPFQLEFSEKGKREPLLKETSGISWEGTRICEQFVSDAGEHFTGLGHGFFGRADGIDLRGTSIQRNYGAAHGNQAPLIVPFFLSSKGYGIFMNSTFPNSFSFGKDSVYGFEIDTKGFEGQMDFFFILGPEFSKIIDRYTQLTGRPRFPPRAVFGLALSDKGNDHASSSPSDEAWWKQKVAEHRRLGFPIDHLINDNRWRAGGGQRCMSYFEWDKGRFPDPAEYDRWLKENGLIATIDFNRCIAARSKGWTPSFNIPVTNGIEFGASAPDFTRGEVRQWFWNLFWNKTLDPKLGYPGDALWIDEFDELGAAPDSMMVGNDLSWAEMKNYWFFLIAKGLVQEGWDKSANSLKRPFVWVRGMTAGAQRYATLCCLGFRACSSISSTL